MASLSRLGRFGLALSNPAALSRYDQQQEVLEMEREQMQARQDQWKMEQEAKRNQLMVKEILDVMQNAKPGSRTRAIAGLALKKMGYGTQEFIDVMSITPSTSKRQVEKVGRRLVEVPQGGGEGEVIYEGPREAPIQAPRQPTETERAMSRLLDLQDKPDLTERERREMGMLQQFVEAKSQANPMYQMMRGMGYGANVPPTQLSDTQRNKLQEAQRRLNAKAGEDPQKLSMYRERVIKLLKDKYDIPIDIIESTLQ